MKDYSWGLSQQVANKMSPKSSWLLSRLQLRQGKCSWVQCLPSSQRDGTEGGEAEGLEPEKGESYRNGSSGDLKVSITSTLEYWLVHEWSSTKTEKLSSKMIRGKSAQNWHRAINSNCSICYSRKPHNWISKRVLLQWWGKIRSSLNVDVYSNKYILKLQNKSWK